MEKTVVVLTDTTKSVCFATAAAAQAAELVKRRWKANAKGHEG